MNFNQIFHLNKRQFANTLKKEGTIVRDYYDPNKTYQVFFRRNERSTQPQSKVRLFYAQDTPITIGTIFTLKGENYVVVSQDGVESDIYFTSIATKCDTTFIVLSNGEYVTVPFAVVSDKFSVDHGSTISMVSGSVVVYTGDNAIVRDMKIDDCYYKFGGYYKVKNFFYNNGLANILLERTVAPQEDTYVLSYMGDTVIDKSVIDTYQLVYTAMQNGEIVANPTLSYSSSDSSVATVDANGLMTVLSTGSVMITATWTDAENVITCDTSISITAQSVGYTTEITASTDTIKVGGSYKTMTCSFYDGDGNDITDDTISEMTTDDFTWTCSIDGVDYTHNSVITWMRVSDVNKIKIKFADDRSYLNQTLTVSCEINGVRTSKDFTITV